MKGVNIMSNRIAELRKEQGLTLDQMQEQTGINRVTISQYERGKREPKLETWQKLSDVFNAPIGYVQGVWPDLSPLKEYIDTETTNQEEKIVNGYLIRSYIGGNRLYSDISTGYRDSDFINELLPEPIDDASIRNEVIDNYDVSFNIDFYMFLRNPKKYKVVQNIIFDLMEFDSSLKSDTAKYVLDIYFSSFIGKLTDFIKSKTDIDKGFPTSNHDVQLITEWLYKNSSTKEERVVEKDVNNFVNSYLEKYVSNVSAELSGIINETEDPQKGIKYTMNFLHKKVDELEKVLMNYLNRDSK